MKKLAVVLIVIFIIGLVFFCFTERERKNQTMKMIEDINTQLQEYSEGDFTHIDINVPRSPWGYSKICTAQEDIQAVLDIVAQIKVSREYDVIPIPAGRGVNLTFYGTDGEIMLYLGSQNGGYIRINKEFYYCDPYNISEQLTLLYDSLNLSEKDDTPEEYSYQNNAR